MLLNPDVGQMTLELRALGIEASRLLVGLRRLHQPTLELERGSEQSGDEWGYGWYLTHLPGAPQWASLDPKNRAGSQSKQRARARAR